MARQFFFIFLLTVLFSADTFSQCYSFVHERKTQPLKQDTSKTIIIGSEKYFVFSDTNRTYVYKWDIADTALYDGTWLLLADNNPDKILLRVTYKDNVIDGNAVFKRSDGTLLEEWNYSKGKLNGEQKKYWFENGQISNIDNYKDGLKDGEHKTFYGNGDIQSVSIYKNGQPTGEHKHWHKNGNQSKIENYDEFGRKQGEFYRWDDKGRLTEYAYFKDNLPIGVSFGFEHGKPTFQKYFVNGQLKRWVYSFYTSPQKYFETKRKRKTEYDFEKTEISFKEEAVWEDTIITVRKYYPSGQLQSEEQIFYAGQKDCKDIYKKTGTHKFWTTDGKLEKELHYKDDILIDK